MGVKHLTQDQTQHIINRLVAASIEERKALRKYQEAIKAGLSDAEAREEGWPSISNFNPQLEMNVSGVAKVLSVIEDLTGYSSRTDDRRTHPFAQALITHCNRDTLIKACLRCIYVHVITCLAILPALVEDLPEIPEDRRGQISFIADLWFKWGREKYGRSFFEG